MKARALPGNVSAAGFSLLEVLVALAVLTASLVVMLEFFSSSLSASADGERLVRAAIIAQSKLAAVGTETSTEPGVIEGNTLDGFFWRVTTTPTVSTGRHEPDSSVQIFTVTVEVGSLADAPDAPVRLTTLKLETD